MRRVLLLPLLLLFSTTIIVGSTAPSVAEEGAQAPPAGESVQDMHGLKVWLDVPRDLSKEKPASMVVILHGAGGTAVGMRGALRGWSNENYVVCAPKSRGATWAKADLGDVLKIAADLKKQLPIDPDRVHVVGYSNGGWNLDPIAFDDALKPVSATWVAAGFDGGSVPKWAATRMGVLALVGSEDGNLPHAKATVPALYDKVRSAEVRVQPGLGHTWPDQLVPYLSWWMGAMDGRFVPGEDQNFDWGEDIDAALASITAKRRGGVLLYVFDPEKDKDNEHAKALQNVIFHDVYVRHYGNQLKPVKLSLAACREQLEQRKIKLKETPAVIVLKKSGKVAKVLEGKIKTRRLVSALKSVAPDKGKPFD